MAPYNSIFIRGVFTFGRRFLDNRNTSPTLRADRLKNEKRGSKSRVTLRRRPGDDKVTHGSKIPVSMFYNIALDARFMLFYAFQEYRIRLLRAFNRPSGEIMN